MEIFFANPTDIEVKDGLERFRKDMGDIESLAESIVKTRQILPIVVNRERQLIDGGRRLAACLLKGIQVLCVYQDTVDDYEMRLLELEANLHRKDYSPAEQAFAIEELHNTYQKIHGEAFSGPGNEGHSLRDTAKRLGKSVGTVHEALDMAAMIRAFPQLATATKKSQIKKAAKGLMKLSDAIINKEKHEEAIKGKGKLFQLVKMNAVDHMQLQKDSSVNILLTDPPYGVGMDKLSIQLGGSTGGTLTSSGFNLKDDSEKALILYATLAHESFRFTTKDAHGYIFIAPEHFQGIRELFIKAGWRAHIKPLIWTKEESGQCNVPHAWPSSCYEMILYIRKDESVLIKQGQPDWIPCKPLGENEKLHQWEKPTKLLRNLLERVALPGYTLYDPFMGSGSSIEIAYQMKMFAIGCDLEEECYVNAVKRMSLLTGTKE